MTVDPVDESQAARLLGLPQAAVRQLADTEASFPSPTGPAGAPTWERAALNEWAQHHKNRLEGLKARHDT